MKDCTVKYDGGTDKLLQYSIQKVNNKLQVKVYKVVLLYSTVYCILYYIYILVRVPGLHLLYLLFVYY